MAIYDLIAKGGDNRVAESYMAGVQFDQARQQAQQQMRLNEFKLAEAQEAMQARQRQRDYIREKSNIASMPITGGEMPEKEFRARELTQKYPMLARADQLQEAEIQRTVDAHFLEMSEGERKKNATDASIFSNIMYGVDKAADPIAEYRARYPLLAANGVVNENLPKEYDPILIPAQIQLGIGVQKYADKKKLGGSMWESINTAASLFNLDLNNPEQANKAYEIALEYKRDKPETKAEGKLYEIRLKQADDEVKMASNSKSNSNQLRYLVDREINNTGGMEGFIEKYRVWMGPQADMFQAGATILGALGWNPDDENARVFLAQVQQLNTDEALQAMSMLGGNDSNEELRRISAKFASITDYGPEAFLSKLWLMELTNDLNLAKSVAQVSALNKEKTEFDREKFEDGWDSTEAKMLKDWREKYGKFLDKLAETEKPPSMPGFIKEGVVDVIGSPYQQEKSGLDRGVDFIKGKMGIVTEGGATMSDDEYKARMEKALGQ